MLQVLARSATGERMNPYTSLWTSVTSGDDPQTFHVILLDNQRSSILAHRLSAKLSNAFAAAPA
jgi:L-lactate dehydrogenase complex protein LldF